MAQFEDLKAEVAAIGAVVAEVAADVDDLLTLVGESGPISEAQAEELRADLVALKSGLSAVAAKHTPEVEA